MKALVFLLLLGAVVPAGDRKPVMVTARPVFKPTVCQPLCVTIDGVDWDIEKIRDEYRTPWNWPGGTEESLRQHLTSEHRITGLERLSFADVQKIHAVIHERERSAKSAPMPRPVAAPAPAYRSSCPGGVCPTRGVLFWRWR